MVLYCLYMICYVYACNMISCFLQCRHCCGVDGGATPWCHGVCISASNMIFFLECRHGCGVDDGATSWCYSI